MNRPSGGGGAGSIGQYLYANQQLGRKNSRGKIGPGGWALVVWFCKRHIGMSSDVGGARARSSPRLRRYRSAISCEAWSTRGSRGGCLCRATERGLRPLAPCENREGCQRVRVYCARILAPPAPPPLARRRGPFFLPWSFLRARLCDTRPLARRGAGRPIKAPLVCKNIGKLFANEIFEIFELVRVAPFWVRENA